MAIRELEVAMELRELKVLMEAMVLKVHLVVTRVSISSSILVNTLTETTHSTKVDRVDMTILKTTEAVSGGPWWSWGLSKSRE